MEKVQKPSNSVYYAGCLAYFLSLNMETVRFSETSANFRLYGITSQKTIFLKLQLLTVNKTGFHRIFIGAMNAFSWKNWRKSRNAITVDYIIRLKPYMIKMSPWSFKWMWQIHVQTPLTLIALQFSQRLYLLISYDSRNYQLVFPCTILTR
jgi:hypothetical protein